MHRHESHHKALLAAYVLNTVIFVPFYCRRKLVPASVLVSAEALAVWLCLALTSVLPLADVGPMWRGVSLAVGCAFVTLAFYRMHRKQVLDGAGTGQQL